MPEWLRRLLESITNTWKGLTPTRKVALVVLTALLLLTLLLFIPMAFPPEKMVALVPADELPEVKAQWKKALEQKGYKYEIRDGAIYVREFEKDKIVMDVVTEEVTIPDATFKFLFETDFASTQWQREKRYLIALQKRFETMIRAIEPVKRAYVVLTPASEARTFGFAGEEAKASVLLELKPGATLTKQNVIAIANIFAKGLRDLKPHNVAITDTTGKMYRVPDETTGIGIAQEILDLQLQYEHLYEKKVRAILPPPFSQTALVAVTVELDPQRIHRTSNITAPGGVEDYKIETKKVDTAEKVDVAAPGIKGNATVGKAETKTTEAVDKREKMIISQTQDIIDIPPGQIKRVSIAVTIPVFYKAGGSSNPHPNPSPEDEKINEIVKQLPEQISKGTNVDTKNISVTTFYVPRPEMPPEHVPSPSERLFALLLKYGWLLLIPIILITAFAIYKLTKKPPPLPEAVPPVEEEKEEKPKIPKIKLELADRPRIIGIKIAAEEMAGKNPKLVAAILKRWLTFR